YLTEARASDSSLVNDGDRRISTEGDTRNLNSSLLWKKKLAKKGRTISVNMTQDFEKGNSDGYLYADNKFYKGGLPVAQQITDQYKEYNSQKFGFGTNITYSEPLSKSSALLINYGIKINNSQSNRNSFNKGGGGKYDDLDTLYSNDYKFNQFT
ncbi:hypothetical protein, partial [Stenotrophomonas maltophilia]|uniref:hypothetical protein n=1 Tax=Stenotrophomonas maltophilia TaxID=40324 RepID=UPI003BF8504A